VIIIFAVQYDRKREYFETIKVEQKCEKGEGTLCGEASAGRTTHELRTNSLEGMNKQFSISKLQRL
jgi:hypothetical protein